jgi:uncharacterized metal-binding protein YceD (DUF177 family)
MNQLLDSENTTGTLRVTKFPMDSEQHYKLDQTQPWIKAILIELNENAETKLPEEYLEDSFIFADIRIEKKFKQTYGECLLVSGSVRTEYVTQCIRTLNEMKDTLEVEFKACYLDNVYEENEELLDQVDIYMDGDVHELYFYEKKEANIKLLIHEQIYLNYNQYPVSDHDAELGWTQEGSATKQ